MPPFSKACKSIARQRALRFIERRDHCADLGEELVEPQRPVRTVAGGHRDLRRKPRHRRNEPHRIGGDGCFKRAALRPVGEDREQR